MKRMVLSGILLLTSCFQVLHARDFGGGMSEYGIADRELYHVYWNVFYRLSPGAQQRLKADEIRWINWKDALPLSDRIEATYERIAVLEQL